MSVNNIYIEFDQNVYSRYKKASIGAIAGKRLDPNTKARTDFLLMSDWAHYNLEQNTLTFNYDTDVIEIYSADEDRVFRILNAYLLQNGMLVPFDGTRDALDLTNALSDVELSDIAASKNLLSFKKKIKDINSVTTLQRIKDVVERADRPYSFIKALEERILEIT